MKKESGGVRYKIQNSRYKIQNKTSEDKIQKTNPSEREPNLSSVIQNEPLSHTGWTCSVNHDGQQVDDDDDDDDDNGVDDDNDDDKEPPSLTYLTPNWACWVNSDEQKLDREKFFDTFLAFFLQIEQVIFVNQSKSFFGCLH